MISPDVGEKFIRGLYKYVNEVWAAKKGLVVVRSFGQERLGYPHRFDLEEGTILVKPQLVLGTIIGRQISSEGNGLAFHFGGSYGPEDIVESYTAEDLFLMTKHHPLRRRMQGRIYFDRMVNRVEVDCRADEEGLSFSWRQEELVSEEGKQACVTMIEDLIKRSRPRRITFT